MQRRIMHVDMDAFYASIEQRDHPEYRGLPLIVGGLSSRGVVATASYEARKFGVHSAMSMGEARRRCPQGVFIRGDHKLYQRVSQQIFGIFAEFSPLVEPLALDEAFLDLGGMERLVTDWQSYARKLKARVLAEVGLVASVGIAPNKYLAKLASDMDKPDGLVVIERGQEAEILRDLPIRALWGVGKKSAEKLWSLGFRTVGQVAKADVASLVKHFGKMAYQFVELANGRDERAVTSDREAQSIGNEITFDEDLMTAEQAATVLLALSEKVGWRLRLAGFTAKTIAVKVRLASFQTLTRSRTLPRATQYDEEIYQTALDLYRQAHAAGGVRLIGVTGSHLSQSAQGSLFPEDEKKQALYKAVDQLKARFGERIITKAKLATPENRE